MTVLIPPHISHDQNHMFRYSKRWDSIYCVTCERWIEEKCECGEGENCPFDGPSRPIEPLLDVEDLPAEYMP